MVTAQQKFPLMPEIGKPDAFYTNAIEVAEQEGDSNKRAALKVGRYVTLALNPSISWEEKQKYFNHVLKHHCVTMAQDDETVGFYNQLADLVRQHAGAEALRLASAEDDMYAARVALGQDRAAIDDDAEAFFLRLLGTTDRCPDIFVDVDWQQLKLIRDQWI